MKNTTLVRQMVVIRIDHAVSKGLPVTSAQIAEWIDAMIAMADLHDLDDPVDPDQLLRDIEADYNVHVGVWNALSDDTDHVPWLPSKLGEKADWRFWDRYERYLKSELGIPPAAVARLDEITDDILARLEDPTREGAWDRRGLVAGQVQSGKTGNYTGLIAKAVDNGYKLVVVLAGVHNSLRSQTQARIDEGILGFDTRAFLQAERSDASSRIGVGKLAGPRLRVNSFTSSAQQGDFRLNVAQGMGIAPGGADPIVLVVKKNKSILENLYKWATHLTKEKNPETGEFKVREIPVLVIDDEADHASVNTKHAKATDDDEVDPSIINGLIRQFLDTFEQTAYVAYTATPFANIFIDPDADHSKAGEDLFPRSFIVNLPAPSNYIGPERVFGLAEDTTAAIEAVEALPIVRKIADFDAWLEDKHKASDSLNGELPASLTEAINFFLLAGAVRALRGQEKKHHSMLVHVTRFKLMQKQVATQVTDYLEDVQNRLAFGEGSSPWLRDAMTALYENDLVPTSEKLAAQTDLESSVGPVPTFEEIWGALPAVAKKTQVNLINGDSSDAFEYIDNPDGVSVIAVGGDKLSRGLTLEGLCVSYYLRASRMYDTLMQMGRWFGYRPGYLDMCRLYTPANLVRWYERITGAAAELQAEFDAMAILARTPADFGLRVRQLPDGLLVTSPAKLRFAEKISLTFSGSISETVTFRGADRASNLTTLKTLVAGIGPETEAPTGMRIWRDVDPAHVLEFYRTYRADRAAFKAQPAALTKYIQSRVADDELTTWTVVIADVENALVQQNLGDIAVGLTKRSSHGDTNDANRYTIRRLVSPGHELVEVVQGSEIWDRILDSTIETWEKKSGKKSPTAPTRPSPLWERRVRSPKTGLLLLYVLHDDKWAGAEEDATPFVGFAASFPASERAQPLEYQVNPVLLKAEFGWDEGEEEDD